MSKNLYEAAILQLRGKALEAYATLELLLTNPSAVPDHTEWVEEIAKHGKALAENENVMITLQQYFGPRFAPRAAPPVAPDPTRGMDGVTRRGDRPPEEGGISGDDLEVRSPTFRRSQEAAKAKEAKAAAQASQDEE